MFDKHDEGLEAHKKEQRMIDLNKDVGSNDDPFAKSVSVSSVIMLNGEGEPVMRTDALAEFLCMEKNKLHASIRKMYAAVGRENRLSDFQQSENCGAIGNAKYHYELPEMDCQFVVAKFKDEIRWQLIEELNRLKAEAARDPYEGLDDLERMKMQIQESQLQLIDKARRHQAAIKQLDNRTKVLNEKTIPEVKNVVRGHHQEINTLKQRVEMLESQDDYSDVESRATLTPTQIGNELGLSAQQANKLLASLGLQAKVDKTWHLTDLGKSYGAVKHIKHGNDRSRDVVRWTIDAIQYIKDHA